LDLPMVIHVREAYDEMADYLLELSPPAGGKNPELRTLTGVVHCYSGTWAQAQKFLDLGLYIGFTGIVTYPARKTNPKPTEDLLEVVQNCPIERILVETDSPYLAPQKYRGERCEPWMVEEVVAKIAEIKGLSVEFVREKSVENAFRLFNKMSNIQ